MKERITYFVHILDKSLNPIAALSASENAGIKDLTAGREWQLKFTPEEAAKVLHSTDETALEFVDNITIRWANPIRRDIPEPADGQPSRGKIFELPGNPLALEIPSGLHVALKLRDGIAAFEGEQARLICGALKAVFGIDGACQDEKSFTKSGGEANAVYQFYNIAPNADPIVTFFKDKLCPSGGCTLITERLKLAQRIDLSYSPSTGAQISALWDETTGPWNEELASGQTEIPGVTYESGEAAIFQLYPSRTEGEIVAAGAARNLLPDSHPKAVQIFFGSRHNSLPVDKQVSFRTSFNDPTGLHPTLKLSFWPGNSLQQPREGCRLFTYLTLPSHFFIDRYQLGDDQKLFLESHNLRRLSLHGEDDLEAPDWAVRAWGSSALLEVSAPQAADLSKVDADWDVTVPLHLRYVKPPTAELSANSSDRRWPLGWESSVSEADTVRAPIPWPAAFWACPRPTDPNVPPLEKSPFDQRMVGPEFHDLGIEDHVFYHIPPDLPTNPGLLYAHVDVPILSRSWGQLVQSGTALAVLVGTIAILSILFRVMQAKPNPKTKAKEN